MDETATKRPAPAAPSVDHGGGPYVDDLYNVPALPPDDYAADLTSIGAEQEQRYHRDGFLAVRRAFPESTVAAAAAALRVVADPASGALIQYEARVEGRLATLSEPERLAAIRKVHKFVPVNATLRDMGQDKTLLSVVERLMGDTPGLIQDQAFLKQPGGREKPWHQDNASFRLHPETPIVSVWIAVEQATAENGCMCLIRGSHRRGPQQHHRVRDFQIQDADVAIDRAVAVPLEPGGLIFFDGLVHHGTPENRSDVARWSVSYHFAPATAPRLPEEDHHSFFGS